MSIKAEQLKQPEKPESLSQQVEHLGSGNIEERLRKLEDFANKHAHTGTDKSVRIGGICRRLNEPKRLAADSATWDIEIPEGYRLYRLYFIGGLSTAAYLAVQFNDITSNSYSHNVTVLQANSAAAGTSASTATDRGYIAYISGVSALANFVKVDFLEADTGINAYRNWLAIGNTQTVFDGNQAQSCIATGLFHQTADKLYKIRLLTSTGNILANSTVVLEGLTI